MLGTEGSNPPPSTGESGELPSTELFRSLSRRAAWPKPTVWQLSAIRTWVQCKSAGFATAGLGIGGEPTPLRGDIAHRLSKTEMALPERFSHLIACLRVRSVLFSRHRHIGLFYSGPRCDATLEETYRASAKWASFTGSRSMRRSEPVVVFCWCDKGEPTWPLNRRPQYLIENSLRLLSQLMFDETKSGPTNSEL